MKPTAFEYHRPDTLERALSLLAQFGDDGRPIAGGQSLVPMMNLRLARPLHLVDINGLALCDIDQQDNVVRIGALVRHETHLRDPLIARHFPALVEGVRAIGHPTIRRNGTLGGSLAHCDPTAELPLLCMLHDGAIVVASSNGERRIAATDFFEGAYMTALEAGEMIVAAELPVPGGAHAGAFEEMAERKGDFAIAAAGVVLGHENGRITGAKVACSGAAQAPMRARPVEQALNGADLASPGAAAVIAGFLETMDPPGDHAASAPYRRALIGELIDRAMTKACRRALEAS